MTITLLDSSLKAFEDCAASMRLPRSLSRNDIPFRHVVEHSSNADGYTGSDGNFVLVVKTSVETTLTEVVESVKEIVGASATKSASAATEESGNDGAVEDVQPADATGLEIDTGLDVVVWVPEDSSGPQCQLLALPNGRLLALVAGADVTVESIILLLINLYRSVQEPFAEQGGRLAWKVARFPRVDVAADHIPSDGEFDIPGLKRRITSMTDSLGKRLSDTYTQMFDRKINSAARAAIGRWSKKVTGPPLPATAPRASTKKRKEAESSEGAESMDTNAH